MSRTDASTSGKHPRRLAVIAAALVLALAATACAMPTAETSRDTAAPAAAQPGTEPAAPPAEPAAPAEPAFSAALVSATVVRVVDGDTAVFKFAGGTQEKVRFIGIDTPESTNSIELYGKEASAYTAKALPAGAKVLLEQDVEERDKYGRLLAYVWLSRPASDSEAEIRGKMLNARLAIHGYAQQMTIQPNSKYAEHFTRFVAEARDADRGLWDPGLVDAAPVAAPAPAAKAPSTSSGSYIGNKNTKKFHYPNCGSVGQMNPENKVPISTRQQAISQGYVPCKNCNP